MHAHLVGDENITLVTHLFQPGAPYLDSDAVFGVKPALVVDFALRDSGPTPDGRVCGLPWLRAGHDFVLQPKR